MVKGKKVRRAIKNKYAFGVYKPNKNCKPVTYNGLNIYLKHSVWFLKELLVKS